MLIETPILLNVIIVAVLLILIKGTCMQIAILISNIEQGIRPNLLLLYLATIIFTVSVSGRDHKHSWRN